MQGEHPAAVAARQYSTPSPSASASTPPPPTDFFSRPAYLTVSHQLHLEALASALSRVYSLSPCFRAEPSLTARHLAEFWMLEAEWAFSGFGTESITPATSGGVEEICKFVEAMLRSVVGGVLGQSQNEDISILWKQNDESKLASLEDAIGSGSRWTRLRYADAIKELQNYHDGQKIKFQYEPSYTRGLQSEHERWLAEQLIRGPVFVTDYPSTFKPFYMRLNNNGDDTVACFDLLIPHLGELVGGSVREERSDLLGARMERAGLSGPEYEWYGDLRRYGGAPHGGFGMGLERLVAWVGGIENARECVPVGQFPVGQGEWCNSLVNFCN